MAHVSASRSKSAPWRWAAAIVFSLSANGLVAGLFWELRGTPLYESAPATVIEILPRPTWPRFNSETPRRPPARSPRLAVRPFLAPAASPSAPTPVVPSAPDVVPPDSADVANLSRTLRGVLGCDLSHLTDAERAKCATRLAANRPATPTPLNFDPHLRYASDPEPYLTRMPKNGCKVRAAGAATPFGQQGVAAGVSCAWSF
jgi:hypothetical protein